MVIESLITIKNMIIFVKGGCSWSAERREKNEKDIFKT